uniref:acyltransferase family protein n=1 Tax=Mangrovimonas sp. TPBH4 TaxID=1645914 RepID=UPI0006B589E8
MNRRHFHTFDALRFFSFLLVFFLHVPKTGITYIDFFLKSGGIGVTFFFVLSGFLITYILLYEKEHTKRISLKNFFSRRILRIWPLFYLMIGFAYVSPYILNALNLPFENEGYKPNLLTSIFFGENYKMMMTNTFPDGAPLRVMWSLCIEEHFYILWGVLFYYISNKSIPLLIILSIVIANIARLIYTYFGLGHIDVLSHLDYFAFGAMPAYLLIHKKSYISFVEKIPKYLKYSFLVFTISMVFVIPNISLVYIEGLYPTILALLFSITILFTLGNNSIHIGDNLWFSKLGVYTYGLY